MPRDPNGNYDLPAGNPVVTGTVIESTWANTTMDDIATALTDSLSRTGKGGMLAPFRVVDGSLSLPGFSFINDNNTGIRRSGDDEFRMVAGAQDVGAFKTDEFQLLQKMCIPNAIFQIFKAFSGGNAEEGVYRLLNDTDDVWKLQKYDAEVSVQDFIDVMTIPKEIWKLPNPANPLGTQPVWTLPATQFEQPIQSQPGIRDSAIFFSEYDAASNVNPIAWFPEIGGPVDDEESLYEIRGGLGFWRLLARRAPGGALFNAIDIDELGNMVLGGGEGGGSTTPELTLDFVQIIANRLPTANTFQLSVDNLDGEVYGGWFINFDAAGGINLIRNRDPDGAAETAMSIPVNQDAPPQTQFAPAAANDIVNKGYVDTEIANVTELAGVLVGYDVLNDQLMAGYTLPAGWSITKNGTGDFTIDTGTTDPYGAMVTPGTAETIAYANGFSVAGEVTVNLEQRGNGNPVDRVATYVHMIKRP